MPVWKMFWTSSVSSHFKTHKRWAQNPSKSGEHLKPKAIPTFLGDVGLIKVGFEPISKLATFLVQFCFTNMEKQLCKLCLTM